MTKRALHRRWFVLLLVPGLAAVLVLAWGLGGSSAQGDTLTVTKTADTNDGSCDPDDCSLREAIARAEDGDTIIIPAGTYTIDPNFGELVIEKDLTLAGAGAEDTVIQASTVNPVLSPEDPGAASFGVFLITDSNVTISGMTIRHGNATHYGGGIVNARGTLILSDSSITNNVTAGSIFSFGGGIGNLLGGTLVLRNSTVTDNTAGRGGGGVSNGGTLSLTNSTINGNRAGTSGGGILNNGTATLIDSTVSANAAGTSGGGIYTLTSFSGGDTTVTVINSIVSDNTARLDGGGFYNGDGVLTVISNAVSNNMAGRVGGGIYSDDPLSVTSSTISNNSAGGDGGGLYSRWSATVANSTISAMWPLTTVVAS